jgi:hypothetical protein
MPADTLARSEEQIIAVLKEQEAVLTKGIPDRPRPLLKCPQGNH